MTRPSCIGLLTDFGLKDHYVGVMKAVIASLNPAIRVIDISHQASPYNIKEASYLLYSSYSYFPKGSIFICVVDPGVGTKRRLVALRKGGYIFLAPDNGVLSFILNEKGKGEIREITNRKLFLKKISDTFHGRDILAPAAAHLSKGVSLKGVGRKIDNPKVLSLAPKLRGREIEGEVLHIDNFGNIITNIHKGDLKHIVNPKVKLGRHVVCSFAATYGKGRKGNACALFGSSGFLEISIPNGNAAKILKVKTDDRVRIL